MKILIIISILFFSFQSFAQNDNNESSFNQLSLEEKREVLISELIRDTIKYSKEDTYHTATGTLNKNSYSPLFIINGKQYFKFDIVEGNCVIEFIEEYLDTSNLKSLRKIAKEAAASALYGRLGANGLVIVELKRLKKAKTNHCGFKKTNKNKGSNFDQWKKGEVRMRRSGILIKEK